MIGYKAHIAADAGTQLVRAARLTPANLHDSTQAAGLVTGDETYVMADKAYDTRAFRTHLKEQGIIDHVLNAARHNKTLTRNRNLPIAGSPPCGDALRRSSGPGSSVGAIAEHATDRLNATVSSSP